MLAWGVVGGGFGGGVRGKKARIYVYIKHILCGFFFISIQFILLFFVCILFSFTASGHNRLPQHFN